MRTKIIQEKIEKSLKIKKMLLQDLSVLEKVDCLIEIIIQCLKNKKKIIFAGNGGSFADAQHLSAEFISRFMFDRIPLASIVLGANNSSITAIANDYGYNQVFSRELEGISEEGDIFIPISTSGNSINILEAVKKAKQLNIIVTALTGLNGGKLTDICNCISVPSQDTAKIQECHIMLGHIICELVEYEYFNQE